jgi:hypothetical protein
MFELPAEATDPEFVELFAYWQKKAPNTLLLPGRRHIDPLEMSTQILPRILLLDVERDGSALRFRFRLAGTAFRDLHGSEVTGRYLDELSLTEEALPVSEALSRIVITRSPGFIAGPLVKPTPNYDRVKRLGLPLADDGINVDMILATFIPIARQGAGGLEEPGAVYTSDTDGKTAAA